MLTHLRVPFFRSRAAEWSPLRSRHVPIFGEFGDDDGGNIAIQSHDLERAVEVLVLSLLKVFRPDNPDRQFPRIPAALLLGPAFCSP